MSIHERLKYLREHELNLTTRAFGTSINMSGGAITNMEKGSRNITERTLLSICREYGVNEKWLRTGEGEIFETVSNTYISALAKEYNLDEMDQSLIEEYLKLDKQSRSTIKNYIRNVFLASEKSYEKTPEYSYIGNLFEDVPKTPEELEELYPPISLHSRRKKELG